MSLIKVFLTTIVVTLTACTAMAPRPCGGVAVPVNQAGIHPAEVTGDGH